MSTRQQMRLALLAKRAQRLLGGVCGAWSQDHDTHGAVVVQDIDSRTAEYLMASTALVRDAERIAGLINVCRDLVAALEPQEAPHGSHGE